MGFAASTYTSRLGFAARTHTDSAKDVNFGWNKMSQLETCVRHLTCSYKDCNAATQSGVIGSSCLGSRDWNKCKPVPLANPPRVSNNKLHKIVQHGIGFIWNNDTEQLFLSKFCCGVGRTLDLGVPWHCHRSNGCVFVFLFWRTEPRLPWPSERLTIIDK